METVAAVLARPMIGLRSSRRVQHIDFELTDEQRLIRATAREFADNEIAPRAREHDRSGRFDTELVAKLGAIGFIGALLPERYGGRGIDYRTYALIVEEIGRADSSVRTVVSVNTSLVGSAIARWGSEEQKQRLLPGLWTGEAMGCFGLTEPDTGSDAANLSTRAQRLDGGWRITGQKQWISLGNHAAFALIFAQTDPRLWRREAGGLDQEAGQDARRRASHRGLAAFAVPTDSPGFASSEIHGKLGMPRSPTPATASSSTARSPPSNSRPGNDRRHGARRRGGPSAAVEGRLTQGRRKAEHDRNLGRQAVRQRGSDPLRERRDPGAWGLGLRR